MSTEAERTRALVNQAVDAILAQFEATDLIDFVLASVAGPADRAFHLYRSHKEGGISSRESQRRTALDELIEMSSLVSIVSGDLSGALDVRGIASTEVRAILAHPAIERYMTLYYPMAYGVLACADLERRLPQLFRTLDAAERDGCGWGTALQRFLSLNAQLLADQPLLEFLFLLDDHFVADTHITELQRAFANPEAMAAWLEHPGRAALLGGLERMLDFSSALHELLEALEAFPILRGRIWLHYSYWLGNGGERVRETTRWLVHAMGAADSSGSERHEAASALESTFHDLTSPLHYAGTILDLVGDTISLPLPARTIDRASATGSAIVMPFPPALEGSDQERQPAVGVGSVFSLPPLNLLRGPPSKASSPIDKAALERNARLLETVLDDFHVKGQITAVHPGPVVTIYELEPAAGTKASRVVQLADDIARNMSAVSARIAPIPGRTVIGIELPNARRETVNLHELMASDAFEDQSASLPIVLGKNTAGDPVIVDLAPMPHLLVVGAPGSGKSVTLNCMILSLLYKLNPKQCRMIMIDPKMLELSMYDDIPHLLSPVVTDPAKAVRALKWAVEQMEDRYRMMASVNVRGLASFNDKVRAAKAKGQPLGRKVQIGYEDGKPVYEEEQLDFEPLPQIVVIVDELADLMMTAGKEVEFLIQRLAQKARAAGIHLIMATQRPSVDVITGVIKASLPTRLSLQVASKTDSRAILGEQGAEQLLGLGDMFFKYGEKITRIHGSFVADEEVGAVADHWRAQGQPDYVQFVTEDSGEGFVIDGALFGTNAAEEEQYNVATHLVVQSQKASTSWLQRQMRIGYNLAARLIERMEKNGVVGQPDHVGRREVLIDQRDERS